MAKRRNTLEPFISGDGPNTVEVHEFADRIKAELETSTDAWWNVASILGEADAQYGFASEQMKALIAEINFSPSKANKLVQIAQSERLQEHKAAFSKVAAWTVLYKLTSLADEDFKRILAALQPETVVTVAWINEVLGRRKKAPKTHKPLFTVQVNVTALKAMAFDGANYGRLEEALEKIKAELPFLEITATDLFEKEQDLIERDTAKAREKVLARWADKAIQQYQNASSEWQQFRNPKTPKKLRPKRPLIAIYSDRAEVLDAIHKNAEEAFATLEADWFSEIDLWNETMQELDVMRQKYAKKLKNSET